MCALLRFVVTQTNATCEERPASPTASWMSDLIMNYLWRCCTPLCTSQSAGWIKYTEQQVKKALAVNVAPSAHFQIAAVDV